jgi:hypothetical protein
MALGLKRLGKSARSVLAGPIAFIDEDHGRRGDYPEFNFNL